jgi:GNAT superfamily N-acetyltransferase
VLRERRRRGVGTALFREVSALARADGREGLIVPSRHDDRDSLDYLGKRGFGEVLRMRESVLELGGAGARFDAPEGISLVPLVTGLERQVYAAATEIARDIPSAQETFDVGSFEQWRSDQLPATALPACSFVALAAGEVAGYAILVDGGDGTGLHAMTGVRPAWRRRGIALALKQAQIDAAAAAGMSRLRTQNALANPMLRVNERLGFLPDVDWLHLRGPLLD